MAKLSRTSFIGIDRIIHMHLTSDLGIGSTMTPNQRMALSVLG